MGRLTLCASPCNGAPLNVANQGPFRRRIEMAAIPVSTSLKWEILVTKRQGLNRDLPPGKEQWMWVPTSAALIYGKRDAVLVDVFLAIEQARVAVEWIAASGREPDHHLYHLRPRRSFLWHRCALLDRFPNAKAVATFSRSRPANVARIRREFLERTLSRPESGAPGAPRGTPGEGDRPRRR